MRIYNFFLDEFNLGDEDRNRAVKECIREMKGEKLITRHTVVAQPIDTTPMAYSLLSQSTVKMSV